MYNASPATARTDVQNCDEVGVGFHRGANGLASGYLPEVRDTRALTGGAAKVVGG